MTDKPSIADLLAKRTAAEKAVADAQVPVLQDAEKTLSDPALQTLLDRIQVHVDALAPGNTRSMLSQVLLCTASARRAVAQDILTHQHTLQS